MSASLPAVINMHDTYDKICHLGSSRLPAKAYKATIGSTLSPIAELHEFVINDMPQGTCALGA